MSPSTIFHLIDDNFLKSQVEVRLFVLKLNILSYQAIINIDIDRCGSKNERKRWTDLLKESKWEMGCTSWDNVKFNSDHFDNSDRKSRRLLKDNLIVHN